jgi:hypothetical protein
MKLFLTAVLTVAAAVSMAQAPCCKGEKTNTDAEFLKVAQEMEMKAEGKKACCKSTEAKPMAKGDKGCCNAPGEVAKFKVFVAGTGYKYFGCKDSAAQGRKDLLAKGAKVGNIQKVSLKASI